MSRHHAANRKNKTLPLRARLVLHPLSPSRRLRHHETYGMHFPKNNTISPRGNIGKVEEITELGIHRTLPKWHGYYCGAEADTAVPLAAYRACRSDLIFWYPHGQTLLEVPTAGWLWGDRSPVRWRPRPRTSSQATHLQRFLREHFRSAVEKASTPGAINAHCICQPTPSVDVWSFPPACWHACPSPTQTHTRTEWVAGNTPGFLFDSTTC